MQWCIIFVDVNSCGPTSNVSSDVRPGNVPNLTSKDLKVGANPCRFCNVPSIQTVEFDLTIITKQVQFLEAGRTREQLVDLLTCDERLAIQAQDLQSRGVGEERVECLKPKVEITVIVSAFVKDNVLQSHRRRG